MAYLSAFKYDIFISYARDDNTLKWVDRFHDYLKNMLLSVLGKKQPIYIWRDTALGGNQVFDEAIQNTVKDSALFLTLLSNNYLESMYCLKELDWFCQHLDNKGERQSHGDSHSRIIHALLAKIAPNRWPKVLKGKTGFQFYDIDSCDGPVVFPLNANDPKFDNACRNLVIGIFNVLEAMKKNEQIPFEKSDSDQTFPLKQITIPAGENNESSKPFLIKNTPLSEPVNEQQVNLKYKKIMQTDISDSNLFIKDMSLSITQKGNLVTYLLECSAIKDRQTRDAIVNELPPYIQHTINRHSSDRVDVNNIITRCMDFESAVSTLIMIVEIYEGQSSAMNKIKKFLNLHKYE